MELGFVPTGEEPRRFQDNIYAQVLPGEIAWIALLQDLNFVPADNDVFGIVTDLTVEFTVDRVPFQEMGESVGVGEIVDGSNVFDVALFHCAKDVATDSAEAIDAVGSHR